MYPMPSLFIAGEWMNAAARITEPVINPATEEVLGQLPHATIDDLDRALAAAQAAFKIWRRVAPYDRAKVLRKAADLLRERAEAIAVSITLEQGKPLAESRGEVAVSADTLDWFADEGRRAYGRLIPARSASTEMRVLREPVGPVAAFCAWNAPMANPVRKLAPALAAGCSVILKASEETPAGAMALAKALDDAGLPKGALNLVFGVPDEISKYLIASDVIRKVTFTGSVPVGKLLATRAAAAMKQMTMELGGHSPVFVFEGADIEKAAQAAVVIKFRNAGQICFSPSRFYVQDRIYEKYFSAFAARAKSIAVGDGMRDGTQMGPLANARRVKAMAAFVDDAKAHGATVVAGGERAGNRGYFWAPTLIADAPDDSQIATQEPFGPIATIGRFGDLDDAIRIANRLPYGLAAYAFTPSIAIINDFIANVDSGTVGINSFQVVLPETPFGGVKDSGIGREGGAEGIEPYLVSKFAVVN